MSSNLNWVLKKTTPFFHTVKWIFPPKFPWIPLQPYQGFLFKNSQFLMLLNCINLWVDDSLSSVISKDPYFREFDILQYLWLCRWSTYNVIFLHIIVLKSPTRQMSPYPHHHFKPRKCPFPLWRIKEPYHRGGVPQNWLHLVPHNLPPSQGRNKIGHVIYMQSNLAWFHDFMFTSLNNANDNIPLR